MREHHLTALHLAALLLAAIAGPSQAQPLPMRHAPELWANGPPLAARTFAEGSSQLSPDIPVTPGGLAREPDGPRLSLRLTEAAVPGVAAPRIEAAPAARPGPVAAPSPLLAWRPLAIAVFWLAGFGLVVYAFARPRRERPA